MIPMVNDKNRLVKGLSSMKNERGYSTIFLCLIIMCLMGVFFLCYTAISQVLIVNEQMRQSKVASEMILSYYNDPLERDYGLLAYDYEQVDLKKILAPYFKGKWQVVPKTSLNELNVFQNQVLGLGKLSLLEGGLEKAKLVNTNKEQVEIEGENYKKLQKNASENEDAFVLSPGWHSAAYTQSKKLLDRVRGLSKPTWVIKNPGEISPSVYNSRPTFKEGSAKSLNLMERGIVCAYIFEKFNDYVQWQNRPNSRARKENLCFEGGEIEYIIAGHREGMTNQLQICSEIFLMREAINVVFLVTNPEKREVITMWSCLVSSIFPIAEPFIHSGITLLWSTIESGYEVNLLLTDHKIPIAKSSGADWYTDLDGNSVKQISGTAQAGSTSAGGEKEKGMSYRDFLLLFLIAQSDEKTAQRTLTLIDCNLKKKNQGIIHWDSMVTAHEIIVTGHSGKETRFEDGYLLQKK